jgi:peroxiredoxin (alkyl hydroperoxide reductase subunit C)
VSETATLKVGDEAPDFEVPSSPRGEMFKLSDYRGKNAIVLNFVPAAFSGVCSVQLPLVQEKLAEFEAQDAIPVGVSCDNAWSLKAWKEQLGLTYPLISDFYPHGALSKAYGVFNDERGTAMRVVVVIDKQGKVAWIEPAPKPTAIPDYDAVMSCAKG